MIAVPLLFQEGICKILESEKDIEIIAKASTQEEIIPLAKQNKPEVLFIDTAIPDLNIVKILKLIEEKGAEGRVILLLHTWNEEVLINALSLGIRGYLTATSNAEQFIKAVRVVSKDEMWVERKIITKTFIRLLPSKKGNPRLLKPNLTKREQEIVRLVVQGYSTKQISSKLCIHKQTVKNCLGNIFKKLDVRNRLHLVIEFLGEGISQSNSGTEVLENSINTNHRTSNRY